MKYLYIEYHKILLKKIKDDINKLRDALCKKKKKFSFPKKHQSCFYPPVIQVSLRENLEIKIDNNNNGWDLLNS